MALILTANNGNARRAMLEGIGDMHGKRFFMYAELDPTKDLTSTEFHDGADLHVEAERLDGPESRRYREIALARIPSFEERGEVHTQLYYPAELDPGRWVIRQLINGREVARREVSISTGMWP